jgi:hypothetical protein
MNTYHVFGETKEFLTMMADSASDVMVYLRQRKINWSRIVRYN